MKNNNENITDIDVVLKENERLKSLVCEKESLIREKESLIRERENFIKNLQCQHDEEIRILDQHQKVLLKEVQLKLRMLINEVFGSSSEKLSPKAQRILDSLPEELVDGLFFDEAKIIADKSRVAKSRTSVKEKPQSFSERTPDEVRVYEPENVDACPKCGGSLKFIGEDIKKIIDFHKRRIKLIKEVYRKYICSACGYVSKGMSDNPSFFHSPATASFVAQSIIDKHMNGMPLYRQSEAYRRDGIGISRQDLANWQIKASGILEPIYDELKNNLRSQDVIHADETPIRILKSGSGNKIGYFWGMTSGACFDKRSIVFTFYPNRRGDNAVNEFNLFQPDIVYVHSDAYQAYKTNDKIKVCRCWVHARRKFYDILSAAQSDYESSIAEELYQMIEKLFGLEREYSNITAKERKNARIKQSLPLLKQLKEALDKYAKLKLDNATGKAIGYCLNNWMGLTQFLVDGRLEIHNNLMENQIRPIAIARKNYLFCSSDKGAQSIATLQSIISTAAVYDLDVQEYLGYLLTILESEAKADIKMLMPWEKEIIKRFEASRIR